MYYICITDAGGRFSVVQDLAYQRPHQHFVRFQKGVSNEDIEGLVGVMSRSRISPKIFGSWGPKEAGLPVVVDYEESTYKRVIEGGK